MEVEAFVVEVASHLAGHTFAVHEEQDVSGVEALHGYLVAEADFLDVESRGLLLECLLERGVAGIDKLFAGYDLCAYGAKFYGAWGTAAGHDDIGEVHDIGGHGEGDWGGGGGDGLVDGDEANGCYGDGEGVGGGRGEV